VRKQLRDEHDPTLSFARQLQSAERRVTEAGGRIVAHFYDIESGTRSYTARGSGGLAGFDIAIPKDGGLKKLLANTGRRPGRFDREIVESINRLSRNSSVAFRVEDELLSAGVRLCAADEPLEESFGTIVLRHVNIGIARGYPHELMVKSRQGRETSTRQGVRATVARPASKTNYLYRCLRPYGICGLRMWGNHCRTTTYDSCQPFHQRSKDIPAGSAPARQPRSRRRHPSTATTIR